MYFPVIPFYTTSWYKESMSLFFLATINVKCFLVFFFKPTVKILPSGGKSLHFVECIKPIST